MSTVQEIKSAIEQLSSFAKASAVAPGAMADKSADRPLGQRAALIVEHSEFWNANPR